MRHGRTRWVPRLRAHGSAGDARRLVPRTPALIATIPMAHITSAWETVRTFSRNDRPLQGTPGARVVWHPHARRLDSRPHGPLARPAAALDAERRRWRTQKGKHQGRPDLFNPQALAKGSRAKLLAALMNEGLRLPRRATPKKGGPTPSVSARARSAWSLSAAICTAA